MVLIERFDVQRLKKVGHLSAPWYQAHTESGENDITNIVYLSLYLHPYTTQQRHPIIIEIFQVLSCLRHHPLLPQTVINVFCTAMRKMVMLEYCEGVKTCLWVECQGVDVLFCKVLHISHVEFQISLIFDTLANSNSWTSNY